MTQPALTGFDWSTLDPDTRAIVQDTTARLHDLERRTGEAIIQIGRGLADTKFRIGHGRFMAWLDAEFGWSYPTAARFMQVAERFDGISQIENFQPSALYALASGIVPESIRDEFLERAEAGETIRHKDVKRRLATVDRDTGEVVTDDDDYPEHEAVDPADPASYLSPIGTHHQPSTSTPATDSARSFCDSLIEAQAPYVVAQAMADVQLKARAALRVIRKYPPDVVLQRADTQDTRDQLDDVITVADELRDCARAIRAQLRAGEQLRAVK